MTRLINFLVKLTFLEVILFTVFRIIFFIFFKHYGIDLSTSDILYSFWIGFRFDLQLAILILLPVFLLGGIPFFGIFKSTFAKYFWLIYIWLVNIAVVTIYIINFAYFDFFKKLVNSSIVRYFYDIGEAWKMVEESYPLYSTITVVTIIFILLFIYLESIHHKMAQIREFFPSKLSKFVTYCIFTVVFIFAGYGKFELYPWRWSEAFYTPNTFLSYLASNPITYFINTLKNKDVKYDKIATQRTYDTVADFLEVNPKDPKKLSLARIVTPDHNKSLTFNKPNVVFFLGESTSFPRSSISGNPLDPTPFIKSMSDSGITYTRYFTPHAGTARSVWTSMTGMCDVERMRTSSRNPMVVQQNLILNYLKGYEKFYFIGGSLSWGNIRGLIGNVKGIHTYEEKDYKHSPHNDVWGISDVDLAGEVNDVLKKQTKPFFAFVHLSSNHKPNKIPENTFGFKKVTNIKKQDLEDYSFDGSLNEYNGQRFLDYSVRRLVTLAQKEKYFDNTIFIFVGDHGLPKKAKHMQKSENALTLCSIHTPLVIYAPKLIKHKVITYPVSEVDIMATIAGLTGSTYVNSTFGRDILEKDFDKKPHYAYYMTHENNPTIDLIGEKYVFRIRANGNSPRLYDYYFKDKMVNLVDKYPEIAKKYKDLTLGIYENTRWTRYHNSEQEVKAYIDKISKNINKNSDN